MSVERCKGKTLGNGGYGIVYAATGLIDGETTRVAIKRNLADMDVDGAQNLRELAVLNDFSSRKDAFPYVARLTNIHFNGLPFDAISPAKKHRTSDIEVKDDTIHFEFPQSDGDLRAVFRKNYSPLEMKSIIYQMVLGMRYTHVSGIVHRDIKPMNFLVYTNEKHSLPGPLIRLTDFGLSYYINAEGQPNTPSGIMTWTHRPPEVCLRDKQYNSNIDCWSLGSTIIQICSRGRNFIESSKSYRRRNGGKESNFLSLICIVEAYPFKFGRENRDYILNHPGFTKFSAERQEQLRTALDTRRKQQFTPRYFDDTPAFKNLVRRMLRINPADRITSEELLTDPFFDEFRGYANFDKFMVPIKSRIFTMQGSKRETLLETFTKLNYLKSGSSTRHFVHLHEFCSRYMLKKSISKESKDEYGETFIMAAYYMLDKFFNVCSENNPEISLSERNSELMINSDDIIDHERKILLECCGAVYQRTIYEDRPDASIEEIWEFIWGHTVSNQLYSTYLEEFDDFVAFKKETQSTQ